MLPQQIRLRRQHHVGRFVLEMRLHQRHRDRGQPATEGLKSQEQRLVERTEKPRDPLHVEDVGELLGRAGGGLGPKGLIGQFDEGRLVGRVAQHPVELGLLPPFGSRLEPDRLPLKLSCQPHRRIGHRLGLLHAVLSPFRPFLLTADRCPAHAYPTALRTTASSS